MRTYRFNCQAEWFLALVFISFYYDTKRNISVRLKKKSSDRIGQLTTYLYHCTKKTAVLPLVNSFGFLILFLCLAHNLTKDVS